MKIVDGKGSGSEAKVDDENRLHTHAFTINMNTASAASGDAFDVSSGLITLTAATESALLYIKNNEDDNLILSIQSVDLGLSTNGVGESTLKYYINPTGGTIISSPTNGNKINRKIGDATTLAADVFKGAEGDTLTGGSVIEFPTSDFTTTEPFIVPKGATFGVALIPPTSNTSMPVSIRVFVLKNGSRYGGGED